jgi:RNA polymerase sigma-70 factor (ECF subfamily)
MAKEERSVGGDAWLSETRTRALIIAAHAGGARELEALLDTLRPAMFAYFARRIDSSAADDLAQRALLILTREYRRIRPDGAPRWLVTVARNLLRDEFRRRARQAGRYTPGLDACRVAAPDAVGARLDYGDLARAVLHNAASCCTPPLRAVVQRVVEGQDVDEIAKGLGISESAVRVRLTRARALLRPRLREYR